MMAGGLKRSQIAVGVLAGGRGKCFGGRPKGLLKAGPGICIKVREVWQSLEVAFVHFSDLEPSLNVSTPMNLICRLAGQGKENGNRPARGRRGRLSFGKPN